MQHVLLSLPVLLLMVTSLQAQTGSQEQALQKELQRLENEFGGHLGVAARNLVTGEMISFNGTERFPTASVIKLPIMTAFFELVDSGKINPATNIVLTPEDKKPGLLQLMADGLTLTLLDAVKLMIVVSENTCTNLVLDRLAGTHEERLAVVNSHLKRAGLKNTLLLNRLYTVKTKQQTPEAIRYGIGMSTPEDMILLMEKLHNRTLASKESCDRMLEILRQQEYNDMVPRLLPRTTKVTVAHKTGWINESKVDVALVESHRATFTIAVFVDKHPDHSSSLENRALLLGAHAARAVWNYFTGDEGYSAGPVDAAHVDWNSFPGGSWLIYRSAAAPFPHPERSNGWTRKDGTFYPYQPHYSDSSITVFVPTHLKETESGTNVIVHFHGHMNDNMGVLERYRMPQAMIARKTNAVLVLPQGPYRARDSFGGKMEDREGLKNMVNDVLKMLVREEVITSPKLNKLVLSAHSGGYRPVAFSLDRGGLNNHLTDLFLFDAFYGNHDFFRNVLATSNASLHAAYTDHLAKEHAEFVKSTSTQLRQRLRFTATQVDHDEVVQTFFGDWLSALGKDWQLSSTP